MKLILTRHGETVGNVQGIMQGQTPGKLTELGIEQAERLAERLKTEKIDFVYSSDLARAADTAKEIIKFHPNVPIEFVKEIRERHMGEFEGKNRTECGIDVLMKQRKPLPEPKGGETIKQLKERARNFLDKTLQKHKNDNVLFVAHGSFNLSMISVITNKPFEEVIKMGSLGNTSVNIFEIDEDKNHKIHLYNCTKHLE